MSAQDTKSSSESVLIHDVSRRRVHDTLDLFKALISFVFAVAATLMSIYFRGLTLGVQADVRNVGTVVDEWLVILPTSVIQQITMLAIILTVVIQLGVRREWKDIIISIGSMLAGISVSVLITHAVFLIGFQPLIRAWQPYYGTHILLCEIVAGLAAFITCTGPWRLHSSTKWSWNLLFIVSAILVILSVYSLVSMIVSILLGRVIGLLIRFAFGAVHNGAQAEHIDHALRNVGLSPHSITYIDATTPRNPSFIIDDDFTSVARHYQMIDESGRTFSVSVRDSQNHSRGYLHQMWRRIVLTGLALRRYRSAHDLSRHHMHMLLSLKNAGLEGCTPYALTDSDESSILVTETPLTMRANGDDPLTYDDAVNVLSYIKTAHTRGITHRNISQSSLTRSHDGKLILAGWENGDIASNSASIAVDRVQIMALLTCLLSPDDVIRAAQEVWDNDTLSSLAPFVQNIIIPATTRDDALWNRTSLRDLRNRLSALTADDESASVERAELSRFSIQKFLSAFLIVIALSVVLTQLNIRMMLSTLTHAHAGFMIMTFAAGCLTWAGSGITLGAYMDLDKRNWWHILLSQISQSFVAVSMPAGVGPAFVNMQFLRKNGYANTAATAIMTTIVTVQYLATFALLVFLGIFTGQNGFTTTLPTGTLSIVIGAIAIIICALILIRPVRVSLMRRLEPLAKSYLKQCMFLLSNPKKILIAISGSLIQNIMLGLSFWSALNSFGVSLNFLEVTFIFLVSNTLGSAIPTPGGLGGVETSLTVAFTSIGVSPSIALSAVLLYRMMTYWVRIPCGAAAMHYLTHKNLI